MDSINSEFKIQMDVQDVNLLQRIEHGFAVNRDTTPSEVQLLL